MRMKTQTAFLLLGLLVPIFGASSQSVRKEAAGIVITFAPARQGMRAMKLTVVEDRVIRVTASPADTFSSRPSLVFTETKRPVPTWTTAENETAIVMSTTSVTASVSRRTGNISFIAHNDAVLTETGRKFEPAVVMADSCYHLRQSFGYRSGEKLYGLGNYQDADLPLNGKKRTMIQRNRDDVVPVIVSTAGYGIVWDNYSLGEFNDTRGAYYLWSEAGDEVRYTFVYGPAMDSIVASYRRCTGVAPMYAKPFYGYIQSKQRYETQSEIVSIVKGFRDRNFPLDVIVQDWMYWPEVQWGQKSFEASRFPDPRAMIDTIHRMNVKEVISIWPNMSKRSQDQRALKEIGGLLADDEHLDVFNADARSLYWKQLRNGFYADGIDGWWADCSEGYDSDWDSPFFHLPETKLTEVNAGTMKRMLKSGRQLNVYALQHTKGIYEGQRGETDEKRVFILTRSAFAGLQRYGASYWSGDVSANWEEFRMQIPAGLNFCMTGIPYWTTDIAGYFIKHEPGWWFSNGVFEKGQADEGFHELYTRWFQFAAFCPLFRAHGADFPREPWAFGDPSSRTYTTLLKFTELRYRLMPYIYSTASRVTSDGYTMMRSLLFDFPSDTACYTINDQFLFGPSILVNPVMEPMYSLPGNVPVKNASFTRSVHLPAGAAWVDLWTGAAHAGGQQITADASFTTMPLFIRVGSIIPFGPKMQYATERTDPIELRIYPGADGSFTLYEDENDSYRYEKGVCSRIEFRWKDAAKELTIGGRNGSFPGMVQNRKFRIVIVKGAHGSGLSETEQPDRIVSYNGMKQTVRL